MASNKIDLSGTLAASLQPDDIKIVCVPHTATILETVKTLSKNGIYSAPVVNEQEKKTLGLIDLGDVAAFLASLFFAKANTQDVNELKKVPNSQLGPFTPPHELQKKGVELRFRSQPVVDCMNFSKVNPYEPLPEKTTTVDQALQALTKVRRVVLTDESGNPVRVISQSSVVRWLGKNNKLIGETGKTSLSNLGAITKPLISVDSNIRGLDAFALLATKQFSSIGIRSANEGTLLGGVSVKDLGCVASNFAALALPVEEFLKMVRQLNLHTSYPTIGVTPNTTLVEAINKFAVTKVHRLYIHKSDTDTKDYDGLTTLGDIVRALAPLV